MTCATSSPCGLLLVSPGLYSSTHMHIKSQRPSATKGCTRVWCLWCFFRAFCCLLLVPLVLSGASGASGASRWCLWWLLVLLVPPGACQVMRLGFTNILLSKLLIRRSKKKCTHSLVLVPFPQSKSSIIKSMSSASLIQNTLILH